MRAAPEKVIDVISEAIRLKELISFIYAGEEKRIFVEPYLYGVKKGDNVEVVAAYKLVSLEMSDNPANWKIYEVDQMLDVRFTGIRIKGTRVGLEEQRNQLSKVIRSVAP